MRGEVEKMAEQPTEYYEGDMVDALCTLAGAASGPKRFIRGEVRSSLLHVCT